MISLYEYVNEKKVTLLATGDVLASNRVCKLCKKGDSFDFVTPLSLIKPIAQSFDLAYYNQESILAGDVAGWYGGKRIGGDKDHNWYNGKNTMTSDKTGHVKIRHNGPQELGDAMVDAGFNMISLANNHTLDVGEKGVKASAKYWKDKDVTISGSWDNPDDAHPAIIEKNGIKIGFISYATKGSQRDVIQDKLFYRNDYNDKKAKADIESIRDKVDVIIVAIHWGFENNMYSCWDDKKVPCDEQVEIAQYLSSLGVDIILGSHSHYVQPIRYVGKTLVAYSLGNFFASQDDDELRHNIGMMLKLTISMIRDKIIISPEVELTYTWHDDNDIKVYPFSKIDNKILPTHLAINQTYINNIDPSKILSN